LVGSFYVGADGTMRPLMILADGRTLIDGIRYFRLGAA
jgi:hypothetical protein